MTIAEAPAPPPPPRETFRAPQAIGFIAIIYFTQFVMGVMIALGALIVAPHGKEMATIMRIMPQTLVGTALIAAVMTFALAHAWAPEWLRDRSLAGFGPIKPPLPDIAMAILWGVALGLAFALLTHYVKPDPSFKRGPLSQLARNGGSGRAAWALAALLLAPLVEEVQFRGLLFKGLRVSWGLIPSAICVTLLFTAIHFTENFGYWPAMTAILVLAVAALLTRLRSGVVASAALHTAYNLVIVAALYLTAAK